MARQYPPVSPGYVRSVNLYINAWFPEFGVIGTGGRGYNSSFYNGNAPGNTGLSLGIVRGRRRGLIGVTGPGT